MFLEKDEIVVITTESISRFGAMGAVILQLLYYKYGNIIPIDIDTWTKPNGILHFVEKEIVQKTINGLHRKGLIEVIGTSILLSESDKKQSTKPKTDIFGKEETKEKKEANEVWNMAVCLSEIYAETKELSTPKRHLRFAQKLLDMGITIQEMRKLYGVGGWWYSNEFKGQKGSPPNQSDITKTLQKARNGQTISASGLKESRSRDDFFR
jgi:hypothetical protein